MNAELRLLHDLIDRCAAIALARRVGVPRWSKADGSMVTATDVELERYVMRRIHEVFPADGLLGEESGAVAGSSDRTWVVDPVDGTTHYASGETAWGTHIALMSGPEVVLGAISRPDLGRSLWAARGAGTHRRPIGASLVDDERLHVSGRGPSDGIRACGLVEPAGAAARALRASTTWIDSSFAVEDIASGAADVMLDDAGRAWDQAPAVVLVEEAGGKFTDDLGGRSCHRRFGLYSNGTLHPWMTRLLGGG